MKKGKKTHTKLYYPFPHLRLRGSKRITYKILLKRGFVDQASSPRTHCLVGILEDSVSDLRPGRACSSSLGPPPHQERAPLNQPEPWYVHPCVRNPWRRRGYPYPQPALVRCLQVMRLLSLTLQPGRPPEEETDQDVTPYRTRETLIHPGG